MDKRKASTMISSTPKMLLRWWWPIHLKAHSDVPFQKTIRYDEVSGGVRDQVNILSWEKTQEIRSGKTVLWDHCFELPHKHLDAEKVDPQDSATVGTVAHKLKLAVAEKLELYDFPGGYAQRFDGIAPGGGDCAAHIRGRYTRTTPAPLTCACRKKRPRRCLSSAPAMHHK